MKKIMTVTEVEGEGLMALLGKRITIFCLNYIYTGDLVGVNDTCVLLENPAIVYETGPFTTKEWKDARSEEHTSELQSLMRISYAVFCLKKNIRKLSYAIRT